MTAWSLPAGCPLAVVRSTLERRFALQAVLWSGASLLAFGLVAAIIPNPVFGRQIPPEPFAIAVWLVSAPLMGLVAATYTATAPPIASADAAAPFLPASGGAAGGTAGAVAAGTQGRTLGTVAGLGAFLAIGCPVCNKIALLLLGTSGAMTVFAPLQPLLGAVSLALLAGTLAWRLRLRTRGGACAA